VEYLPRLLPARASPGLRLRLCPQPAARLFAATADPLRASTAGVGNPSNATLAARDARRPRRAPPRAASGRAVLPTSEKGIEPLLSNGAGSAACRRFYAAKLGRPSLPPGRYFRLMLLGYFEGLSSERGMAWRAADSLAIRSFLGLELDEAAPDHSTISRTRRLIDVETHERVFTWVLERLAKQGLLVGRRSGSTRRRSRRTRRCGTSCGGTRERATRSS